MNQFKNIAVYGGGSWGTALACQIARGQGKCTLFLRNEEIRHEIATLHTNGKYLKGAQLNPNIYPTNDLADLKHQQVIIIAVPSSALKVTIDILKAVNVAEEVILLIATKGLTSNPTSLLSEYIKSILPNPIAFIAGPNFAVEIAKGLRTHVTIAAKDINLAEKLAYSLESENFLTSTTEDIITVQIAGALKNIIAIQSGIYEAKRMGENAKAGLITQGLQEIMILSEILGGSLKTLQEAAVIGDLVLTCYSKTSRNTKFGYELAQAPSSAAFIQNYPSLVEGLVQAKLMVEWIKKYDLKLPIISSVIQALELN